MLLADIKSSVNLDIPRTQKFHIKNSFENLNVSAMTVYLVTCKHLKKHIFSVVGNDHISLVEYIANI